MAERCSKCGSADTSTGLHGFSCLICGAKTVYDGLAEKGVVADNASYAGDNGTTYHGDHNMPDKAPVVEPVKKAAVKKAAAKKA